MGEYGFKADMYGVGVIMYQMLTGQLPHKGETETELLYGILFARTGGCPKNVRPETWQLVQQLLHVNENLRPSADELIDKLISLIATTPTHPTAVTAAQHSSPDNHLPSADVPPLPPAAPSSPVPSAAATATSAAVAAALPSSPPSTPLATYTEAITALFSTMLEVTLVGKHISATRQSQGAEEAMVLSFFLWLLLQSQIRLEHAEGSLDDKRALLECMAALIEVIEKLSIGCRLFCRVLPHPLTLPTEIYTIYLEEELPAKGALHRTEALGLVDHLNHMEDALMALGAWQKSDKPWEKCKGVLEKCRHRAKCALK
eukprot:gene31602-38192_t